MQSFPTAPVAAASLIVSWGVVEATGSRPAGGIALAAGAAWCIREWYRRRGAGTALALAGAGAASFALSHVLGAAIGAWPAVILVAAAGGGLVWVVADAPLKSASAGS